MNHISNIISFFWELTAIMAPSLLLGFLIAGILSAFITPELIKEHLGKSNFWQICKASIFGVPLPLCSCSVLPVAASLRKNGAGKGSTISFLTSTPQTGVDSIFITNALLGGMFTIIRVVVAFITGILAGSMVRIFTKNDDDNQEIPEEKSCCKCENENKKESPIQHIIRYGFITLPKDIGKSMLVGLLLSAIITSFLPANFFADKLLGNEFFSMIVMLVIGIIIYVCSSGSVPIVLSLIASGISPGAGLVFLITGPATNLASLTTLTKIVGTKSVFIYLATLATVALISGYILNQFMDSSTISQMVHSGHKSLSWLNHLSAVILLIMLGQSLIPKSWLRQKDI
ncbi:MAG: SO_0444 family Cu/Zn efflux transporter [Kiritimatiellae bacterium]|jgi:uncharacterized membrane protein YraQ (UPF0718 family)|nr:SO_0444 family Cu/Zn efflux transporter [Kiritimatiellia bacterium]